MGGRLQNLILHASDAAQMQIEPQLADFNTRGRRSHAAGVFNYYNYYYNYNYTTTTTATTITITITTTTTTYYYYCYYYYY